MKRTLSHRCLLNCGGTSTLLHSHKSSCITLNEKKSAAWFSTGRKSAALEPKKNSSQLATALDTNPPKGTRDFFPEEYRLQSWLYGLWRGAAQRHGFEEYDAPVVEQAALFTRKAGEEITQQLYTFADKSGRELCLRPEMTPSLARMVLGRGKSLPLPIKWFSVPQCWRYEKMSRGRRREHYQWNMDIWGVQGVEAEAELLSTLVSTLESMGLTAKEVGIKVNSKNIMVSILEAFDIAETEHTAVCIILDKWDKLPRAVIHEELQKILLDSRPEHISKLLDTINLKDIDDFKAVLGNENGGIADMERLLSLAEIYGYRDWLVFDATIVRGLSYYTGVVFEAFDRKGEFRAICGGGRYDRLLDSFTAKDKHPPSIPAVGFGFGDAVIMELLRSRNLLPDMTKTAIVDVVVCSLVDADGSADQKDALQMLAIKAATDLRRNGLKVDLILENKRAKWMFQRADKLNAGCTLMFGTDELGSNGVVLKDMQRGSQEVIAQGDMVQAVSSLLLSQQGGEAVV